jgi:hypothetical protein
VPAHRRGQRPPDAELPAARDRITASSTDRRLRVITDQFRGIAGERRRPDRAALQKIHWLVETDPQIRDARPIDEIAALSAEADVPIGQILEAVMDHYADRPAIGPMSP